MRLGFGDCTFDAGARELTRSGKARPLSPKAFQMLGLLLDQRPRAIPQAELRDALWPQTHVARTSLARLVTEIRRATGDTAHEPRYVRNVYGVGYAFCGSASETASAGSVGSSACGLVWGLRDIPLGEGENLIGRSPECRLTIDSPQVSRRHARIFVAGGQATVEDLSSKNGTFRGERRVERPTRLADGDTLIVGPALLVFRGSPNQDSTKTG